MLNNINPQKIPRIETERAIILQKERTKQSQTPPPRNPNGPGFKPDFTQKNPYQNAPPDYIDKIRGTTAYQSAINKGWIVEKQPAKPPVKIITSTTKQKPRIQPAGSSNTSKPATTKTAITEEQKQQGIVFEQLTSNPDFVAGMEKATKEEELKQRGIVFEQLTSNPDFVAGMDKVAKNQQKRQQAEIDRQLSENPDFINNNTRLGDGSYMPNTQYDTLSVAEKHLARNKGISGLQEYWKRMNIPQYTLPEEVKDIYEKSNPQEKFEILMGYNKLPSNAVYTGSKNGEPMYRMGNGVDALVMSPEFRNILVESTIPLVYTINHWDEMGTGEKALSIAMDALFFLPLAGAAAKGAKATNAVTRLGRMSGAIRGISQELILQAKAPIDILLHPVATIKGTARQAWDMVENIGHYNKLPEAVISTTNGTVRIPISKELTPAKAAKISDQIMEAAVRTGEDIVLEFNGQRFTVARSPLMKSMGGGLSHATPQGENFLKGIKVELKSGMPISEQGIFASHEPLPKFASKSAFGKTGEMPAIYIMDPETARNAINTGKIYKSPAGLVKELERKFPVGYELPEPTQVLFTRIGPERVKTALLLTKPLPKTEIAKLKGLMLIEDLKAPFKPSLLIEGKQTIKGARSFANTLDEAELMNITRVLERSGNRAIARNLKAVWNGLEKARSVTRGQEKGSIIATGAFTNVTRQRPTTNNADIFTIRAEKVGRSRNVPQNVDSPRPVRIANDEALERIPAGRKGSQETATSRKDLTTARGKTTTTQRDSVTTRENPTTPRSERGSVRDDRREPRSTGDNTGIARVTPRKDKDDSDGTNSSDLKKEEPQWDSKQIESAIAWKDGFVVHAITAPYRRGIDERTFHIDYLPPGLNVQDITGKGSQEKTIIVKGKPPEKLTVDVGNQDVEFTRIGNKTLRIKHVRDTKGTKSRLSIKRQQPKASQPQRNGMRNLSKKQGRVYRTRMKGGDILSKKPIRGL